MLEKIDLNVSLNKKSYREQMKNLSEELSAAVLEVKKLGIPVIIAFEGWSSSGKGTQISRVVYPMDPRYFNVYTMNRVTEDAYMRPYLWSYFTKTPEKGRITILDKSWNRAALPEGVARWKLGKNEKEGFYYDINAFEEQLTADGNIIIKFFLHISKSEQKKRFDEISRNPDTSWRVDEHDRLQNKDYHEYLAMFEHMIQQTNTDTSPWSVIEANDKNFATVKIYKIIISRLQEEIAKRKGKIGCMVNRNEEAPIPRISVLSSVDADKTISDNEYKDRLKQHQTKLRELEYKLYTQRKSVIIVYEGWDAAGKGGNIKRLTEEMDPRGYAVVPVAAPSSEELSHHYLWRFWNKFPKDGHVAIFDRSWYGRVMVERVEGLCTANEWKRAYREINDMELHLHNHGTIIMKFWLQIDKDEQLRRFTERQNNPLKQYKITDEDWRNREKWSHYELAINEMLFQTDTPYAPWTIVESNNKKFARIKVLEHVTKVMEQELNRKN